LLDVDGDVCSVPRQWTDLVAEDPEIVFSSGRALLRVRDLVDLAGLVERLIEQRSLEDPG
jgi:hypothetical protein